MEKPLVSIIVPVYGTEDYIEKCAASLFGQTYPNIEYIFVNDGTKDNAIGRLQSLLDSKFPEKKPSVTIINKENEGLGMTRMRGLEACKGDFISFVDSDDWMETNMIERLLSTALEKGSDMVYCGTVKEYDKFSIPVPPKDITPCDGKTFIKAMYCREVKAYMWNKIYRRKLCLKPDILVPKNGMHEDTVFQTQMLYDADRIDCVHDILCHYRKNNEKSITSEGQMNNKRASAKNLLELYKYLKAQGKPNALDTIEYDLLVQCTWFCIKAKCTDMLLKYPTAIKTLASGHLHRRCSRGTIKQAICIRWCRKVLGQ